MSTVYMVDARSRNVDRTFLAKLDMILDAANLDRLFSPGEDVVIKTHLGEVGNTAYLRPVVIRALVEKILSLGSKPLVVDTSALDVGRPTDLDWFEAATMHGFGSNNLGAERTLADSYTGDQGELLPTGFEELPSAKVARVVKEARALLVVSHVTGHPLTGMEGALVGLGLGCLSRDGKERVHQVLKPQVDMNRCDGCGRCSAYCTLGAWISRGEELTLVADRCNGCGGCLAICAPRAIAMEAAGTARFQERVAQAAMATMKAVNRKARFFNFLMDVTPQPDTYPFSDSPFVPNLGILMSDDPVSVDQASLDMINRAPGLPASAAEDHGVLAPGQDKLTAITGVDPTPLILCGNKIDLGSSGYRLMIAS